MWEDQTLLPALVPIRKDKRQIMAQSSKQIADSELLNRLGKDVFRKSDVKDGKKSADRHIQPVISSETIEQIDYKFKSVHDQGIKKQKRQKKTNNDKAEQILNSKFLIAQMMHKIQAKNIAEELYPITNQKIKDLIIKNNEDIMKLQGEAEKKEASLLLNSNNQHLRKDIQNIKVSIDRCITIKELYNEKINFRNKISVLQANLFNLKDQNRNLQIRISKGMQDVENHRYNLPCEKEKILSQKLKICEVELTKEKDVREKLSKNISQIIKNFNKLYQEADIARLVVASKLKQLQDKEKSLAESPHSNHQNSVVLQRKSPQQEALMERKLKSPQNITKSNASNPEMLQTNKKISQFNNYQEPIRQTTKQSLKTKGGVSSLEEQMRKMQSNQNTVSKFIKY